MIWNRHKLSPEMIRMINPTSKAALKNQCLLIAQGDLQRAKEIYDYYIEGLEDLPAFDPVPPTWMDNAKDTANGIIGWLQNNGGSIAEGVNYIRGLLGKGATAGEAAATAAELEEEVAIEE